MRTVESLILRLYARFERRLLKLNYRLATSRWVRWPVIRPLLWWLVFKPVSELGAAGQPLTLGEASAYVKQAARKGAVAVGPCGCRTVHRGCDHPTRTDIVVYAGVAAWREALPTEYEVISADQAMHIMEDCNARGMAQILYRSGMSGDGRGFVICNCCPDGCLTLLNRRLYPQYRFHHGGYVAQTDAVLCTGCATCVEVCPFEAVRLQNGRAVREDCYGCGLCAEHCPEGAVRMVERTRIFAT